MTDRYYLTTEEVKHYQYMLDHNYPYIIVNMDTQRYVIFKVVDKEYIGIAWPIGDGKPQLRYATDADVVFEPCLSLQSMIMEILGKVDLKILLFPRY